MKKLLFCMMLLLIPFMVKAQTNYKVTDYYVSSEIEIAGGLKIKELIVLDGDVSGFAHNIDIKNPRLKDFKAGNVDFEKSSIYNCTSVDDIKVATFKVGKNVSFKNMNNISNYLEEANDKTLGNNNTFTVEETKTGKKVQVYNKSNNQKIAFYYEYVVTNAVVMHNDVAELYYPFLGKSFTDDIENVQIQVILPFADETNSFNIWAHGPMKGDIKKIQNDQKQNMGALVTTKNIKAKTGLDVRMTFDKELIAIDNFLNKSHQKALPKIKEIENKRAKNTKTTKGQLKTINYVVEVFDIVYIMGMIALGIYTYLTTIKKNKDTDDTKAFMDNYSVEFTDYLYNKKITRKAFIASIMNLIIKKNISVNEIKNDSNEVNYSFSLNNNDNLTKAEEFLVKFLFETIGNGKSFTNVDLKNYTSKSSEIFANKYSTWQNMIINENSNISSENNNPNFIVNMIYIILGIIIFAINFAVGISFTIAISILIIAIIYLISNVILNKKLAKTHNGNIYCQNFKKDLENFGKDGNNLPDVSLWEKYLIYAVIFGQIEQLQKEMQTIIKNHKYKSNSIITNIIKNKYSTIYKTLNKNIKSI